MKTLYLDTFSGISGDMFLGALLDLGVDFDALDRELRKLNLSGYHLHAHRTAKVHITGTKFEVHEKAPTHAHAHTDGHHHHPHTHSDAGQPDHDHGDAEPAHAQHHLHRTFESIRSLIGNSTLSDWVKSRAVAVFRRVAEAEGKIHGLPPDQVHFHEVGALDSIIDIVGGCVALDLLGQPRVVCAPLVDGTGFVRCAHGNYPIPTPATLAILGARGAPLTQCSEPQELITPTGAALAAEFAEAFSPMTHLVAERIGFGIGTRENQTRPNVLRAVLGTSAESTPTAHDWETDDVAVLETNLDDISSEILGHFIEQALAAGALDVFHTPIQMKKSRPGILLSLLSPPSESDRFTEMILRETSAFGVRRTIATRRKLNRRTVQVDTPWGSVTVKLGFLDGNEIQRAPEYEDCRRLATQAHLPVRQVYEAAMHSSSES